MGNSACCTRMKDQSSDSSTHVKNCVWLCVPELPILRMTETGGSLRLAGHEINSRFNERLNTRETMYGVIEQDTPHPALASELAQVHAPHTDTPHLF